METITRTVYGALLQTCQYLGIQPTIPAHTTLNEKLSIQASLTLVSGEMPAATYVVIGNKGHKLTVGTDSVVLSDVVKHEPSDGSLFNMLPFVLREPSNDLSAAERASYRLRRIETYNNVEYVAYYGKVLDLSSVVPQMQYRTITDGVTYATEFTPTTSNLNPTPTSVSDTGDITTSGDYLAASAKVPFTMSETDMTEFLSVANIIYGDERYAIISEIGIVAGVDRQVLGDFNGSSASYTEVVAAQVTSYVGCMYPAVFNKTGIEITLDMGSVETLLTTTS